MKLSSAWSQRETKAGGEQMFLALRRTAVWFGRPTRTREQYSRRTSACAPWFCARPRPLACGQPSRKFCRPHCGILCPATPRISRLQTYSRSCSFSYVNLPAPRAYISYLKILQRRSVCKASRMTLARWHGMRGNCICLAKFIFIPGSNS